MKQMMHVLVVFVLAVLLQACAGNANVVKAFEGERAAAELARIKMPAAFALRRIDDRGFGIFSRPPGDEHGFYEIQLPPGSHLITLFYSQYWEDLHETGGRGYSVESEDYAVRAELKPGHSYVMQYQAPKSKTEAFRFTRSMKITLVDEQDGTQFAILPANHPGLYQLATTPPAAPAAAASSLAQQEQNVMQEDPLKRLKFWWLMAEEKDRQAFLEWMKSAKP